MQMRLQARFANGIPRSARLLSGGLEAGCCVMAGRTEADNSVPVRRALGWLPPLALAALALLRADSHLWSPPPAWLPYATAVGEEGRFVLQDGTHVDLNTGSRIAARFTGAGREIRVTQGEALFTVSNPTPWPLSVRVGEAILRARDARFMVRMRAAGQTEVLVITGRISIDAGDVSTQVDAGQLISLKSNYVLGRVLLSAAALNRRTAWVDGWLWFVESPLPEAIAEFNRYHDRRLVLVDPALARVRIGGRFRSSDLASFIATLEHSFGVRAATAVVHGTDTVIYLSERCRYARQHCN